jgi:predicted RNase H-like HicB family nuclease
VPSAASLDRFVIALHPTPRGCFARVVNLPGCFAKGADEIEAVENVRVAIRAYIALEALVASERPRVRLEIRP